MVQGALCADQELPHFAAHVLLLSSHIAKKSTRDEARPGRHQQEPCPSQGFGDTDRGMSPAPASLALATVTYPGMM